MDNLESFSKLQDEIVRKGTEQTPFNYWLQINNVDVKLQVWWYNQLSNADRVFVPNSTDVKFYKRDLELFNYEF